MAGTWPFTNYRSSIGLCLSRTLTMTKMAASLMQQTMKRLRLDDLPWSHHQLRKKKDPPPPVTWGADKGLVTQAKRWGFATGHDITKPEMLLVCLLAVLTINSQGAKAEENYTHWSFVPHPPILHPKVWGQPLPIFWNNASHALGGGPLPGSYNISVVPVNNCSDANCTRPPTPPPFLPYYPKVQTYTRPQYWSCALDNLYRTLPCTYTSSGAFYFLDPSPYLEWV
jgi:hypothetical protein